MIKILTLFKIIPNYDNLLKEDWARIGRLDTSFTGTMYDAFDEGALEGALCLKDKLKAKGEEVYLAAAGCGIYDEVLLTALYGAGYDLVKFFEGESEEENKLGEAIVSYGEKEGFDIIFTGYISGSFAYRREGAYIANKLNLKWYSNVTSVDTISEKTFQIKVEEEKSYKILEAKAPFVCSFGNSENPSLRLFSLKARLEAQKKTIEKGKLPKKLFTKKTFAIEEPKQDLAHCQMIKRDDGLEDKWLKEFLDKEGLINEN